MQYVPHQIGEVPTALSDLIGSKAESEYNHRHPFVQHCLPYRLFLVQRHPQVVDVVDPAAGNHLQIAFEGFQQVAASQVILDASEAVVQLEIERQVKCLGILDLSCHRLVLWLLLGVF